MKQLLILSGKGGTGKTTVASAFIQMAAANVYADCDVDAPNLHLIKKLPSEAKHSDYYGMPKAYIDPKKCLGCDLCRQNCKFNAIYRETDYWVDEYTCEGCGVCEALCQEGAVTLRPSKAGELRLYAEDLVFSTAELNMGSGTSGKLVTEVKRQMKSAAKDAGFAIIDGSPGIGCPVIASISGVDMVLIVAEPTVTGISDMERIINTTERFNTQVAICVNKYNTDLDNTKKIIDMCHELQLAFVGKIPFDPEVVKAINKGQSISEVECPAGQAVKDVFDQTIKLLFEVS
ncbi:P-loop ATPase, MinD superfamily [Desulfosporosinus orientis DSM 765]|uniref:p-loop ATPase, MinD superfamily n=1 Tax=Desulfosporosinus orientis (strain ATCC 19365 / DSM 765 / NCIMB 8382 / VKM B-1628 / Singapore I) TaxID=768706 RepID=G7W5Q1_DESOD|nr:ATP-binding protein [Desulfosporosinus orientis]AET66989.1 P-loop ATPase, MinD superfamily [Desulfosporosinus orientis DSM 765]